MPLIHQVALYSHIAIGACALFIFWIPALARKGSKDHKRFGKIFAYCMYAVSISGLCMSSLDLLFPVQMHAPDRLLTESEAADIRAQVRDIAIFLFSLSVLVLSNTRQGWLTIMAKEDRSILRAPSHLLLCVALVVVGVILFTVGIIQGKVLYIIFALIQIASGSGQLRYNFKAELTPKEWWIEHLGAFIGSGIGAYTAFFVFGGQQLFAGILGNAFADIAIFFWITPSVIGVIAITYLSRHYRRKFDGSWALKHAANRKALFE